MHFSSFPCMPHALPTSHTAGVSLIQKETTEDKGKDVTVHDRKAHGEWRYSSIHSYPRQKESGQSHTLATVPLKKEHPFSAKTHSTVKLNGHQCYPTNFQEKKKKSLATAWNWTMIPWSSSPQPSHYSELQNTANHQVIHLRHEVIACKYYLPYKFSVMWWCVADQQLPKFQRAMVSFDCLIHPE